MNTDARRPLKVRDVPIAQKFARYLSQKNITPNQISILSVFFAAIAAFCLFYFSKTPQWWLPVLAAFFIQMRLLCNLFDGMVAVEGGKSTHSGELFNDIPDRIADPLILICSGYAITMVSYGSELGWLAGILAVSTAYVRTLSASIGAPVNFQGPMAKQHRMAVLTIACLSTALETVLSNTHYSILVALFIIILGSVITVIRRTVSASRSLENKPEKIGGSNQ
ncbi:MAG: CDP-alcohol phosphatidyltransferase family protein [Gammaproteobacteria bacterium]|nr:CDP-alcohol phosphatidyltransferase family protein [Gammaproteobacteria bacterium]